MHYTGLTFRPPFEAYSLILQVTTGCSHNACTFCSMYRCIPFAISPLEEVEADLQEAARHRTQPDRVFLANGDAFCLPAGRLLEIAELIRTYLPSVRTIGGYASVKNIVGKTDEELAALARAGFADFNIGVESGLDDVLAFMNKGYTLDEAREQLGRLGAAGMPFNMNIINGAAGSERIEEAAEANAAIVNDAKPALIFVTPLRITPNTPLYEIATAGGFSECTVGQNIDEEISFVRHLDVESAFFGLHVSNPVPAAGILPRDKDVIIGSLENGKARIPEHTLNFHPSQSLANRFVGV